MTIIKVQWLKPCTKQKTHSPLEQILEDKFHGLILRGEVVHSITALSGSNYCTTVYMSMRTEHHHGYSRALQEKSFPPNDAQTDYPATLEPVQWQSSAASMLRRWQWQKTGFKRRTIEDRDSKYNQKVIEVILFSLSFIHPNVPYFRNICLNLHIVLNTKFSRKCK